MLFIVSASSPASGLEEMDTDMSSTVLIEGEEELKEESKENLKDLLKESAARPQPRKHVRTHKRKTIKTFGCSPQLDYNVCIAGQ